MFGSGDFWDKLRLAIFESSELALVLLGQFQNVQKSIRTFIPNCATKHVVPRTFYFLKHDFFSDFKLKRIL